MVCTIIRLNDWAFKVSRLEESRVHHSIIQLCEHWLYTKWESNLTNDNCAHIVTTNKWLLSSCVSLPWFNSILTLLHVISFHSTLCVIHKHVTYFLVPFHKFLDQNELESFKLEWSPNCLIVLHASKIVTTKLVS